MVAIPNTNFWQPNDNPTGAQMNSFYRDNFEFVRSTSPQCRLVLTASPSIAHNTYALVSSSWSEAEDSDNMHTAGSGLITVKTDGLYEVSARAVWESGFSSSATSGYEWSMNIALNNAGSAANMITNTIFEDVRLETNVAQSGSSESPSYGFTDLVTLSNGDTLEMWVYQNTNGGSQPLHGIALPAIPRKGGGATSFCVRWVGRL